MIDIKFKGESSSDLPITDYFSVWRYQRGDQNP